MVYLGYDLGYVHTYTLSKRSVFEKIRFGVSTRIVRQSGDPVHTDVDWSKETCLHLKITASVLYMYVDRDRLASSSNRIFFIVSFACQCRSSALRHVLVPQGRSAHIMGAGDKRKAPKAEWNTNKRRSKMKQQKKKNTDLRLSRRRGWVASEDNSNHPSFVFEGNSLWKKMSCCWFRQRDCTCTWSNIYRVGKPFLIALETVAEKIRIPCSHAKKIRIRNLHFRRSTFGSVFEKLRFGVQAFSKSSGYVRIRVTVSVYPGSKSSVFEKTRVRVHVALDFLSHYIRST